jgi:hypothetical protein
MTDLAEMDVDKAPKEAPLREVKRSAHRLIVDDVKGGEGDNSCITLSTAKMEGACVPPHASAPSFHACAKPDRRDRALRPLLTPLRHAMMRAHRAQVFPRRHRASDGQEEARHHLHRHRRRRHGGRQGAHCLRDLRGGSLGRLPWPVVWRVIDTCLLACLQVRMNKVVRKNLRVKLGDIVSINAAENVPYGKAIHVLPFDDSIQVGADCGDFQPSSTNRS